jgi:pyruvate kinase
MEYRWKINLTGTLPDGHTPDLTITPECVMLNKGTLVIEALGVLDSILKRMEQHQTKKRALLRALRLAQNGR